jgi:membrane protease subunit HflC
VRKAVNTHDLISIVRSSNRIIENPQEVEEVFIGEDREIERIIVGRDKIRELILVSANKLTPYGIELIDVRIKRVNYIEDVRRKVYERMIAERKRAAEQYRSEGRGIREEIEGRTEKELKGILSEAYKKSQEIKGEADATSAKIYADAYNKDPELFSFLKTLDTYKQTVDENTTVILTTDSEYFKYLKEIIPQSNP